MRFLEFDGTWLSENRPCASRDNHTLDRRSSILEMGSNPHETPRKSLQTVFLPLYAWSLRNHSCLK